MPHTPSPAAQSRSEAASPAVSVVIPCYRQAEYLPFAVASVALQTFRDLEIVIVDDGSPDDTAAVARGLAKKLPDRRIRLVRQENRGLSEARNAGIRAAAAPLVLPLDADDALYPEFLEKTVSALRADPTKSIAGTDVHTFGARSGRLEQPRHWHIEWMRLHNPFACSCVFYRRVWEAVGGYNPNLTAGYEDWDFWLGCCERGFEVAYLREPLLLYRLKEASMARGALLHHESLHARIALNHPGSFTEEERGKAARVLLAHPLPPAREAVRPELGSRRDFAHLPEPPEKRAAAKRNLVICRAGDRSVHRSWLGSQSTRSYDVWLDLAGGDPAQYAGDPAVISVAKGGPNWPRIAALASERAEELLRYEAVFVPGDDILASSAEVDRLFEIFHARRLELAQPAMRAGSSHRSPAMLENRAFELRTVSAVEADAPIFSRDAFARCPPGFAGIAPAGAWPALAKASPEGVAVLDAVPVFRTRASEPFARARSGDPADGERGEAGAIRILGGVPLPGGSPPCAGDAELKERLRAGLPKEVARDGALASAVCDAVGEVPERPDGPAVSVVIPCYGQAHFLEVAVASVFRQTFRDFELIIVDDGSPDDTAKVAERLIAGAKDLEVRLLRQKNAGLARARNAGIRASRGRYLLPLDADDALDPTFLEKTVAVLEADPTAQIAGTDSLHFGAREEVVRANAGASAPALLRANFLNYCSLYRREVFEALGGYDPRMPVAGYEDWNFWISAAERGFRGVHIAEPLFFYRVKGESMMTDALRFDSLQRAWLAVHHPALTTEEERRAAGAFLSANPPPPRRDGGGGEEGLGAGGAGPARGSGPWTAATLEWLVRRQDAEPNGRPVFEEILEAVKAFGGTSGSFFLEALVAECQGSLEARFKENRDLYRYPRPYRCPSFFDAAQALFGIVAAAPGLEKGYRLFADPASRRWMVELMALRALGTERVRLPTADRFPEAARRAESELLKERGVRPTAGFEGGPLHRYDLSPLGVPVEFISNEITVLPLCFLGQYDLRRGEVRVGPRSGDVVLEGGACYGDSALWLAHRVGPKGRVHCFEFVPANLELFAENMALNPSLASRIEAVPAPLWSRSGERFEFAANGSGSRLSGASPGGTAVSVSVDDFVARRGLERVDFVKMDIEGAELEALRGAEATLRRFRPRLAISAYHKLADLWTLPTFLEGLGVGYRLYLDHHTIHSEETVLYAIAA